MNIKSLIVVGLLIVWIGGLSLAIDRSVPLSLQACYQLALSRSEVLADQQEQVIQAEEHYKQAIGAQLPSLTGLASYTLAPNSTDQLLVKANASYPLFRGFRMVGAIKQNEHLLNAQKEARQWAALQLYTDVAQALYLYAYLQQDIRLLIEQQSLLNKRLNELRGRVNIGRSRATEVYSLDVSLIQLQTQGVAAASQLDAAESLLTFLTGKDIAIRVGSTDNFTLLPLARYQARMDQRPDIKASMGRVESAKVFEQITKEGESTPQIDLNGNLYVVRPAPNQSTAWDAQIQMTLPNFLTDVAYSKTRESASIKKQAEIALTLLRRQANNDIETVYTNLTAEKKQLQLLEKAQQVSEKNVDTVINDYRLGLSNNLDVLQAMNAFIDIKRSLNKIRFAYLTDQARLASMTADQGIILP